MDIKQATTAYESWLGKKIPLLAADLKLKHQLMAENSFQFLRATFYRWSQLWPEICPDLAHAPAVLGVGDLHVENFGTWHDSEGRLIWGVNDFDEVATMPYAVDLVRLAVSAQMAISDGIVFCDARDACAAILDGYAEGIKKGGQPFVLAEHHPALRDLALDKSRDPAKFWDKMNQWPDANGIPPRVKKILLRALPETPPSYRIVHRQAGLGSLGRRRFTLVTQWCGGFIAREAKELVPSAWCWEGKNQDRKIYYATALARAVRAEDPTVSLQPPWLIRRLAPYCSRIELIGLPKRSIELKLLRAMGVETANIHLGTKNAAKKIAGDLRRRPAHWLYKAAQAMEQGTLSDWKQWRAK
jgi:hypothetical protein